MKKFLLPALIVVILIAGFVFRAKSDTARVTFAKVARETISSTISTNGKVEPSEFVEIHVDAPGLVKRLLVHQGDAVARGQLLLELSQPGQVEDLAAAEARAAQARAELETLRRGGRTADISELEGNLNRLRAQREAAQRNLEALERLVSANAATRFEADQARQMVRDLDTQIQSLGRRRGSLVSPGDVESAQARVRESEANIQLAKTRIGQNAVRAPMGGILYSLAIREGAFLTAGALVGSVGILDPARVRVYVDEPDLGRIATGQPVRFTWDAVAGKEWTGTVQKRPTEVIALGTRQVGEVLCTVSNPARELVPGVNVNAFILTRVVESALTIPRTAVRRERGTGAYVLNRENNTLTWRQITTGASDALRVEIRSGLSEGDLVGLPGDDPLTDGAQVIPTLPVGAT